MILLSPFELEVAIQHLSPVKMDAENFRIDCPECGHRECGINFKKQNHPWNCFRKSQCGKTGLIWHILPNIENQLQEKALAEDIILSPISDIISRGGIKVPVDIPKGFYRSEIHPYWLSRGLDSDRYECWMNTGEDVNPETGKKLFYKKDFTYLAVKRQGVVRGFMGRRFQGTGSKYDNYGDLGSELFGIDEVQEGDIVFVLEGEIDANSLRKKLLLGSGFSTVATFSAKFTQQQGKLLQEKNVKSLNFLFDPDVKQDKMKRIVNFANNYAPSFLCPLEGSKDVDEASVSAIMKAITNRKNIFEI